MTGTALPSVLPTPSPSPAPQQTTCPVRRSAQVNDWPALTPTASVRSGTTAPVRSHGEPNPQVSFPFHGF